MNTSNNQRMRWQRRLFLAGALAFCLPAGHVLASAFSESAITPLPDSSEQMLAPDAAESFDSEKKEWLLETLPKQQSTPQAGQLEKTLSLIRQGSYAEAQQQLEGFIKANPGHSSVHEILGLVLLMQNKMEPAIAALQKAVALDSRNSAALTKLGIVQMALGRNDKAEQALLKAVAIDPDDRFASQRLGMLYEDAGKIDKAVSYYEKGIQGVAPDYVGIKINLAGLYNRQKQFDKTVSLLERLFISQTKDISGHILLGTAFLYSKETEKALQQYKFAATLDKVKGSVPLAIAYRMTGKTEEAKTLLLEIDKAQPKNPQILYQLGETYSQMADYPKALQSYRQAIDAGFPEIVAQRRIATLQMKQAQYTDAIETLRRIVADKGSVIEDRFVLGEAYQFSGQFADAEKLYTSLTSQYPKEPVVWFRLGLHFGLTREYARAIDSLQKAQDLAPKNPAIARALTLALFQAGKTDEALKEARELTQLQPDNKDHAFLLASLYQETGKLDEARKMYSAILASPPPHAPSLNNLADLTAQAGNLPEALKLAGQAVAIQPENSRYLDTLGWISFQMNNLDAAQAALEKAHSLSPELPVIQFHLGKVYLQRGNTDKAKELLRSSISQPAAPWAEEANTLLGSIH